MQIHYNYASDEFIRDMEEKRVKFASEFEQKMIKAGSTIALKNMQTFKESGVARSQLERSGSGAPERRQKSSQPKIKEEYDERDYKRDDERDYRRSDDRRKRNSSYDDSPRGGSSSHKRAKYYD